MIVLTMFVLSCIGCSGKQVIVKTVYIKPEFEIPQEPTYYQVEWKKIDDNYCIDIDNAKLLLKNYYILKTYNMELLNILIMIKGGEEK